MSLRQLGFTVLSFGVAVGSYFVLTRLLTVPSSITAYVIVALCAPFMALGFIRINGCTFEEYVRIYFRHRRRGERPRRYTIRLRIDEQYADDGNPTIEISYVKRTGNRKRRRKNAALQEITSIKENKTENE